MPQDREVDVYMSLADLLEFARSVEGQGKKQSTPAEFWYDDGELWTQDRVSGNTRRATEAEIQRLLSNPKVEPPPLSRRTEVLGMMAATVAQTADSVQNIDQSATWAVEFAQAILAKVEQAERQE